MKKLIYIFAMSLILLALCITAAILDLRQEQFDLSVIYVCLVAFSIIPAIYFLVELIKNYLFLKDYTIVGTIIIFAPIIAIFICLIFSPIIMVVYYYRKLKEIFR